MLQTWKVSLALIYGSFCKYSYKVCVLAMACSFLKEHPQRQTLALRRGLPTRLARQLLGAPADPRQA